MTNGKKIAVTIGVILLIAFIISFIIFIALPPQQTIQPSVEYTGTSKTSEDTESMTFQFDVIPKDFRISNSFSEETPIYGLVMTQPFTETDLPCLGDRLTEEHPLEGDVLYDADVDLKNLKLITQYQTGNQEEISATPYVSELIGSCTFADDYWRIENCWSVNLKCEYSGIVTCPEESQPCAVKLTSISWKNIRVAKKGFLPECTTNSECNENEICKDNTCKAKPQSSTTTILATITAIIIAIVLIGGIIFVVIRLRK